MEFGLCCKFVNEPVTFKSYTRAHIQKLLVSDYNAAREKVVDVVFQNIDSLQKALDYCQKNSIRSFRISSDLIPHLTFLQESKIIDDNLLNEITEKLSEINTHQIVLSMHPGQHVNMGSPHLDVIKNSIQDLNEHFIVAEALRCMEINIHVGGMYGNKPHTIERFIKNMRMLIPSDKLKNITIENDELNYSVEDITMIAKELGIRATYDIHHQRCYCLRNPSAKTEKEYLELCRSTWNAHGIQRVHISSPKYGYTNIVASRPHHDYININDFPSCLLDYPDIHLDIEAKAKELAVADLRKKLTSITVLPDQKLSGFKV
jgi:UV DNA damage endonuclease